MISTEYITKQETVEKFRDEILAAPVLGADTETTGLDPLLSNLRLLQIATSPERAFVFDIFKLGTSCLDFIRDIFKDKTKVKIFHNAKFDEKFLRDEGIADEFQSVFDTYLASVLVNCGDDTVRNDLASVARHYANIELDKTEQKSNFAGDISEEQIKYAARDAAVLLPVRDRQNEYLRTLDLCRVAALEFDAVEAVACMELDGFYLDHDEWKARVDKQTEELVSLREKLLQFFRPVSEVSIFGEIGVDPESPIQVLKGLHRLGIDVEDTMEANIKHLAHTTPVIQALLDYREVSTALKMFGGEYLNFIHPHDGRVHADFKQIGTPTGRFTCYEPNLLQVPQEGVYRSSFKAQGENRKLVIADFSQIELRILAQFSRDERLVEAFCSGADLHAFTAAGVFNKPIDQISPKERFVGKGLNFGTVYGIGPKRFARNSGLPYKQATAALDAYWSVYKQLDKHLKKCEERAVSDLESHSYSGRTWRFSCDQNDYAAASQVKRLGRNFPIQATCSDILKRTLYLLREGFRNTNNKVVNVVHDEIVVECDVNVLKETEQTVLDCMSAAADEVLTVVPSKVDVKTGDVWQK